MSMNLVPTAASTETPRAEKNTDSPKGAKVATDWGASGDELVAAEFCIDEAWARFCLLYPVDNPVVARKK